MPVRSKDGSPATNDAIHIFLSSCSDEQVLLEGEIWSPDSK